MKRLPSFSLRQWLTLPYVALVLVLALTIGALSYRAGSHAVDTVADHLLLETVARIGQAVDRHVVGSAAVLEAAFPNGMPAPASIDGELDTLRTRFWIATSLHLDPNNYVYYGSRQGQFFGLWRDSIDDAELRVKLEAGRPRSLHRFRGIRGELSAPQVEARVFEPRERPWYLAGARSTAHTWTSIYIDFRTAELVATRARRVLDADGELEGVVATDLSLRRLNDFVRGLAVSEHALAFIVEPDGKLIASSRSANVRPAADGVNVRINAVETGDALQVAAYRQVRALLDEGGATSGPRALRFDGPDGDDVQLAFSRLHDRAGLDWITVVAVPRHDFMQGVTHNVLRTAGLGLLAALAVMALGLTLLSSIGRDLRRLALAAREVGEGRLDAPIEVHRHDEIGALAHAFRTMQQRLRLDALTGLVNRDVIVRAIDERLQHHRRQTDGESFAVLFIDLNAFKRVNDRYGHEAGDRVLIEVGDRLRRVTRRDDLIARYAGDEFVVLLGRVMGLPDAERIRLHVEKALREPFAGLAADASEPVTGGAAVGLALAGDGDTADALIAAADRDMYRRKPGPA